MVILEKEFGFSKAAFSGILNVSLEYFYDKFFSLVETFQHGLMHERASIYVRSVEKAVAPLDTCVGLIDRISIFVARPKGMVEWSKYNGHKRRNGIKMQAVSTPDGLIFHLYIPVEGRRHNLTVFRNSGLEPVRSQHLMIKGSHNFIYRDPAYIQSDYLQVGFGILT